MTDKTYDQLSPEQQRVVQRMVDQPEALTAADHVVLAASPTARACAEDMLRVRAELERRGAAVRDEVLAEALGRRDGPRGVAWLLLAAAVLVAVWFATRDPAAESATPEQDFTLGGTLAITTTRAGGGLELGWPAAQGDGVEARVSVTDAQGTELWSELFAAAVTRCTIPAAVLAAPPPVVVMVEHLLPPDRVLEVGWIEIPR